MDDSRNNKKVDANRKNEQLEKYRKENTGSGKKMTSDAGLKISNDERSLKAGKRGPTLFQDFHFYKKQSHFNRERIPERAVHARGYGAHGEVECYKSTRPYKKASILQAAGSKVPAVVRAAEVIG